MKPSYVRGLVKNLRDTNECPKALEVFTISISNLCILELILIFDMLICNVLGIGVDV